MAEIRIEWEASKAEGVKTVSPTDLDLTEEEWNGLSEGEKRSALQGYLDEHPDQIYMAVTKF